MSDSTDKEIQPEIKKTQPDIKTNIRAGSDLLGQMDVSNDKSEAPASRQAFIGSAI